MLGFTMERLLEADHNVASYYRRALEIWRQILNRPGVDTADGLADTLGREQLHFEQECGGRWLGQEIMAAVGIWQFYSTVDGFTDETLARARLVRDAFSRSMCSVEVKGHADRISSALGLDII